MSSDSSNIEIQELVKMAEAEKEQWQQRSIYKLPEYVTNINDTVYTPQVVSFGPYHCENKYLKPMEGHKDRAIKHFLKRSRLNYDDCLRSLSVIKGELMDAYDWLDPELQQNPDAFLKLMIRDGIFMLEIFGDGEKKASGYAYNDPIFSKHGDLYAIPLIKRDMLMLENQIPLKVLHRLYWLQPEASGEGANKVVFQFFFPNRNASTAPTNSLHILDMYRTVILGPYPPSTTKTDESAITKGGEEIIRSAVELQEAGINIKKSKTRSLRDISFKKGKLRLPMINVDDTTKPLFLNLMAYERFHYGAGNDVTAYVFFMDNIIDDAPDVRLLHSRDIIQNGIGSDTEAAKLFNSLSKDISLDKDSPLGAIYESVNAYCKKKRPRYRAAFCRAYCTSPWAIVSVLAAVLLFALTITQTVYAIMDFHK